MMFHKLRGSIFWRTYLFYAVMMFLGVTLLGTYMSNSIKKTKTEQSFYYAHQQALTLQNIYAQQLDTLEFVQERIYSISSISQPTIYHSIAHILTDDAPFSSSREYADYMQEIGSVYTFLDLVQKSLRIETSLFMIIGAEEGSGNMNLIWPLNNQSLTYSANEIRTQIAQALPGDAAGRNVLVLPSQSHINPYDYILYTRMHDAENPLLTKGYIVTGYSSSSIDNPFQSDTYPLEGELFLVDSNGTVIYDSSQRLMGKNFPHMEKVAAHIGNSFERHGVMYDVLYDPILNFYTIAAIDKSEVNANIARSICSIVAVSLCVVAAAIVITGVLTNALTKRIAMITTAMSTIEKGCLQIQINISPYDDELDKISRGLNHMVQMLDDYIYDNYTSKLKIIKAEVRQQAAELYALQNQINPHFLFNALEIIRMKAVLSDDEETAHLIQMLGGLFRSLLDSGTVVTIEEEIAHSLCLIEILRAKIPQDIEVQTQVDSCATSKGIIKNLIQPLAENIFVHGFASLNEQKSYRIQIHVVCPDNEYIDIWLCNNGIPIPPETLAQLRRQLQFVTEDAFSNTRHIGLLNVHSRIQILYGKTCGVRIEQDKEYTKVGIRIRNLSVDTLNQMLNLSEQAKRQ